MKTALIATALIVLAGPALAAPGDPRIVRGTLEWPATLSAEQFIVVRGDDGHSYYADVSSAKRMTPDSITGRISMVGVEGTQPYEIAAVVVGSGDSALVYATPPAPADAGPSPSSLAREAVPAPASPNPAAAPPAPPAVPRTAAAPEATAATVTTDDFWQIRGKVTAVTPKEFVVETRPGEAVRVDVSKLSAWTHEAVRAGDEVKLFGVPQNDRRLVANGFIQEVQPEGGSR